MDSFLYKDIKMNAQYQNTNPVRPLIKRRSADILLNCSILQTSPVTWTVDCGSDATDLFLDTDSMMVSTKNGAGE